MSKFYYEIGFYGEGNEKDFTWYIKNNKELSNKEIKEVLITEFKNQISIEDMENIDSIEAISSTEFTSCCSIEA